jgi:hypothetical protein
MALLKKIFRRILNLLRLTKTINYFDYVLGFGETVAKGRSRLIVSARPNVAFRPHLLVVPSDIASHFLVSSIKIGEGEQFASTGPVPAVLFTEKSFAVFLRMDVARPSDIVSVTVENTSDEAQVFKCGLVGPVA